LNLGRLEDFFIFLAVALLFNLFAVEHVLDLSAGDAAIFLGLSENIEDVLGVVVIHVDGLASHSRHQNLTSLEKTIWI